MRETVIIYRSRYHRLLVKRPGYHLRGLGRGGGERVCGARTERSERG
jgi:hypothetical protein